MSKIRVLLADDHAVLREGLRTLLSLQEDIEVVGEAENGQIAVEMAKQLHPDVVVMDIAMPIMDGMEATRALKQELVDVRVLILSQHDNREYVFSVLQAGAAGYVLKKSGGAEVDSGDSECVQGRRVLAPRYRARSDGPIYPATHRRDWAPSSHRTRKGSFAIDCRRQEQQGHCRIIVSQRQDRNGASHEYHGKVGHALEYRVGQVRDSTRHCQCLDKDIDRHKLVSQENWPLLSAKCSIAASFLLDLSSIDDKSGICPMPNRASYLFPAVGYGT